MAYNLPLMTYFSASFFSFCLDKWYLFYIVDKLVVFAEQCWGRGLNIEYLIESLFDHGCSCR